MRKKLFKSIIKKKIGYRDFKKSKFEKPIFHRLPDNKLDTIPLLNIVKLIEKQIRFYKPKLYYSF